MSYIKKNILSLDESRFQITVDFEDTIDGDTGVRRASLEWLLMWCVLGCQQLTKRSRAVLAQDSWEQSVCCNVYNTPFNSTRGCAKTQIPQCHAAINITESDNTVSNVSHVSLRCTERLWRCSHPVTIQRRDNLQYRSRRTKLNESWVVRV